MLESDPSDVFLRYGLAMEMRKEGDHAASLSQLQSLRDDSTPYIPAFFMAAQQHVELEQIDEARALLRDGIEEARKQNDLHAAGEMSELLATLGDHPEA